MLASLTTVLYIARSLLPAFASLFLLLTTVFLLQVHRPISLPLCPASFSVTNNSSYVALRVLSLSRVSLFSFASYSENCVLPTPAIIHVFPPPPDTGASPARPFLVCLSLFLCWLLRQLCIVRSRFFSGEGSVFRYKQLWLHVNCPLFPSLCRAPFFSSTDYSSYRCPATPPVLTHTILMRSSYAPLPPQQSQHPPLHSSRHLWFGGDPLSLLFLTVPRPFLLQTTPAISHCVLFLRRASLSSPLPATRATPH